MKKILKIFVVGAIAALLSIIMSCSAVAVTFSKDAFDAGYVQVALSVDPVGTILSSTLSAVDKSTGLTGYELLRNSIYQDVSLSMESLTSALGKRSYKANAGAGISSLYSELAKELSRKGIVYSNERAKIGLSTVKSNSIMQGSTLYPGLTIPSSSWASVCDKLYASTGSLITGESSSTSKLGNWLIFTVNNSQYAYPLGVEGGSRDTLLPYIQRALFEAFLPYSFAIYEYSDSSEITKLNNVDLNEDNLRLSYLIHPLVGVIPCNIVDDTKTTSINTVIDYMNFFYPSDGSMETYSDTCKDFISSYRTYIKDSLSAMVIPLAANDKSATLLKSRISNLYNSKYTCFFMGTAYIDNYMQVAKKGTLLEEREWYGTYGFNLHLDYITWALRVYSKSGGTPTGYATVTNSLDNKLTQKTNESVSDGVTKSFVDSVNFVNRTGTSVNLKPVKLVHTLYPLVTISEWNSSDIFGIYSAYDLTAKGTSSKLGVYLSGTGYHAKFLSDGKFNFKQLFGSASGASYITGYKEDNPTDITLNDNVISISNSTLTKSFYIDIMTGKVYTIGNNYPTQRLGWATDNPDIPLSNYTYIPLSSHNLLYSYVEFASNVDLGNLYISQVSGVTYPGYYCNNTTTLRKGKTEYYVEPASVFNVVVPSTYMECIKDVWTLSYTNAVGQTTSSRVTFYVGTGRKVSFNYDNAASMDLYNTNGVVRYENSDSATSGVYYNSDGRVSTTSKSNLKMNYIMLKDGPAIVLNNDYVQDSEILNWLETSAASEYMSNNVKYSGYTADLLYKRLTSKGVTLNPGASEDDQARYDDIATELSGKNANSVMDIVLTFISFVGLILMVYACALVIAYYIDIFNTVSDVSILNIITFGNCRAVHSKEDLADLGITDSKEKRKYCTQFSIIGRWALTMGFGILLFASNQVYISILRLYLWLMSLVG